MTPEMPAKEAADVIRLIEGAGIEVWLDGGWAVDAVLGEQTRTHKDLDIILHRRHVPKLRQMMEARGFAVQPGGSPSNFVLADDSGLEVDVHAIEFDDDGNGLYEMAEGATWVFPASGFEGRGVINGLALRCLTPQVQVLCHAHGYVPAEKDFRDMELLEARFGVELPSHLRRAARGDQTVEIRRLQHDECGEWLHLRESLWPGSSREELRREQEEILADPGKNCLFVAAVAGSLVGFVEVALRDWAEGCGTRPVGYIEAWYVNPEHRRSGIGRELMKAAEHWALSRGCTEMGSDAELHNSVSHGAHGALGYDEVTRLVLFSKKLAP
jgi:GNAT superfamily N-acetyltransferase